VVSRRGSERGNPRTPSECLFLLWAISGWVIHAGNISVSQVAQLAPTQKNREDTRIHPNRARMYLHSCLHTPQRPSRRRSDHYTPWSEREREKERERERERETKPHRSHSLFRPHPFVAHENDAEPQPRGRLAPSLYHHASTTI